MAAIVATATAAGGAFFGAAVAFFLFFCAASNCAFNRNRISVRCSSLAAFVVFFAFVAVVNFVLVVCFLRRGGVTVAAVARRVLVVVAFFAFAFNLCCRRSLDHFELTSPLMALQ